MEGTMQDLIRHLKLEPHPEGGFYRETYRSKLEIEGDCLGKEYSGTRNSSTCIYFMLTSETFSALHRIHQDEVWHFYKGTPLVLHMISPDGVYTAIEMGNDLNVGHHLQFVVPGGFWFGASVKDTNSYSLVGCTVSPGFDFTDFELGNRTALLEAFPRHEKIILALTRV